MDKKNILLDLNKVDDKCTSEGGFHMTIHVWGISNTMVYHDFIMEDELKDNWWLIQEKIRSKDSGCNIKQDMQV